MTCKHNSNSVICRQCDLETIELNLKLDQLVDADGALLVWQVQHIEEWWKLVNDGEIRYDAELDLFVHPGAKKTADGTGYMIDRRAEEYDDQCRPFPGAPHIP